MTTSIENFNRKECELIPAAKINAYTDLYLDPENPTGVILDTSWGQTKVDLKSVVKAGETITHLYLAPEDAPEGLCYEKEDGTTDYIPGDELSRIISLSLLKDVDQDDSAENGDVLMWTSPKWKYYNLQNYIDTTDTHLSQLDGSVATLQGSITNLQTQVNSLQNQINALSNRLSAIENAIYAWDSDKTTKIPRGNINIYGDTSNTNNHSWGVFSHSSSNNITNDLYFS